MHRRGNGGRRLDGRRRWDSSVGRRRNHSDGRWVYGLSDGARAVGDGQSRGSSDRVSLVAMDNGSRRL